MCIDTLSHNPHYTCAFLHSLLCILCIYIHRSTSHTFIHTTHTHSHECCPVSAHTYIHIHTTHIHYKLPLYTTHTHSPVCCPFPAHPATTARSGDTWTRLRFQTPPAGARTRHSRPWRSAGVSEGVKKSVVYVECIYVSTFSLHYAQSRSRKRYPRPQLQQQCNKPVMRLRTRVSASIPTPHAPRQSV
jgi:hypothetical protein